MGKGGGEMPDETPAYRALAEQTVQYYNRFQEVFKPLEEMYISEVFKADDESQYAKAMDAASSAVQREFDPKLQQMGQRMLARGGVTPGSGAFSGGLQDPYTQLGTARGLVAADAAINNTDRYLGGVSNVIKRGQGQASDAMQGQIGLARAAEDKARSQAMTAFADSSQKAQVLGTGLGLGAGLGFNYFGPNDGAA